MAKTFYVIRCGWNAANQSSINRRRNPKNSFESNLYKLLGVVQADSEYDAIIGFKDSAYSSQFVFAVTNIRSIKGLTAAARNI